MEPRIQYATTSDGVKIAYWTLGRGTVRVDDWGVFSDLQREWEHPGWRNDFERGASKRTIVRFNHRASGLSQRNTSDFSLDAMVLDLEAVVDHLGLERFALYGQLEGGLASIAYAARHPERVSHLMLSLAWARGPDSSYESFRAVREKDWDLFLETYIRAVFGWSAPLEVRDLIRGFFRNCVSPEEGRRWLAAIEQFDVTSLLPQVRCPALVVHHSSYPLRGADVAMELTSSIPDARLRLIDEEIWQREGWEKVEEALDGFLEEGASACPDGLTPREVAVLRLIASGRSNKQIAEELTLSVRTVGRHISNVYSKIGAHGRAEATGYALRHDLMSERRAARR